MWRFFILYSQMLYPFKFSFVAFCPWTDMWIFYQGNAVRSMWCLKMWWWEIKRNMQLRMNWKGGDCNKITHKANKLYAFKMGQLGHAEWVPPHTQQGGSSLQWGARGQGGGNRRWRASQAKKVGRVFFRGLHHWGRRAGQVRGFSISYFLFVLSGVRVITS